MLDSKLTIKPFLNKRLKDKNGKFLLYARITYKRKSNEIAYKNLVFNSDVSKSQTPYNKEFLYTDEEFIINENKFIEELYNKIEPIFLLLARYDKDDLLLFPNIITKLNKSLIKVIKHIYYFKLENNLQKKMVNHFDGLITESDLDNILMTTLESFVVAEETLYNKKFLYYDFLFVEKKKKEIYEYVAKSKLPVLDYDIETYKMVLNTEITNYLFS